MNDRTKEPRALVGNASDPDQVRQARTIEKNTRERELADIRAVLETPEGNRFAWRLMSHCKTFESVFNNSGSITAYNTGRQDVGHFLMTEVVEANPSALIEMMSRANKENDHG